MIPKFPEFKKLELSDQVDVEKVTSKYEPYSDFDFPTLWSWDVNDNALISELNGNLIVIITDHFSGAPFYSFLGNIEVNQTLKKLFAFSAHGKTTMPQLKLVPEASLQNIDFKKYLIEIDLNNYDYIYDIQKISTYEGIVFSDKRRKVNAFLRNHAQPSVTLLDISKEKDRNRISILNSSWGEAKIRDEEELTLKKELVAIDRFLKADFKDTLIVGVVVDDILAGYSMFTLLPNQYAICHFSKGDVSFSGIYEFLMRESARILLEKGRLHLNYQEDLGLPGLRFWKNSFKPSTFLRKYSVREL